MKNKRGQKPQKPRLSCFVIMPSGAGNEYAGGGDEALLIFDWLVRPTVKQIAKELGFRVRIELAVETATPAIIAEEIVEKLQSSHIVIADLTGRNANVYYELGVRYSLDTLGDRPTVPIAQSEEDLAFDVAHIRAVIYGKKAREWQTNRNQLGRAVREAFKKATGGVHDPVNWNPVQRVVNQSLTPSVAPSLELMSKAQVFKRTWQFERSTIAIIASSQPTHQESHLIRHYHHATGSGQFDSLGLLLPPMALAYQMHHIEFYLVGHLDGDPPNEADLVLLGGATNDSTDKVLKLLKGKPFEYHPAAIDSEKYSYVEQLDKNGQVIDEWDVVPDENKPDTIKEDFGIIVWTHLPENSRTRVLIAFGGMTYGTEAAIRFVVEPGGACNVIQRLRPDESIAYGVRTRVEHPRCGSLIGEPMCFGVF